MAIFNPEIPTQPKVDQYISGYSEPIKHIPAPAVIADESTGYALKAAGTAISGVAELADSTVKGVIKNDVYNRVDAERDSYTGFLDATKNPAAPNGGYPSSVGDTGPNQAPVNLMAQSTTPVPQAIDGGIQKLGTIQAGLDGKKITETTYYQRLNSITKDLRSTYPGYRDYIDTEVSKITGVNPANAYITSLISDINAQNTTANKEHDYWRGKIIDSGFPDNDKVLAQYEKDGNYNRVAQYLAYNNGVRSMLALKKAGYEAQGQDRATQLQSAEDFANTAAVHAATTHFYNSQRFTNGDASPADIADKMADLSLHPEKANDVAYQGLSERYAALHTQAYNQTMRVLTTSSKDENGKIIPPVSNTLGAAKTKDIVDKSVGALFDKTREFIADKQFSPAYNLQNAAAATANNAYFKLLTDPTVGGRIATATAINKAAPNLAPVLVGKTLTDGLDTDLGTFIKEQGRQAVAGTGGKYVGADGKQYSFRQSLEELDQASAISGKPTPGQAYNNLLEIRKVITDPSTTPEARANAIKYFYDPINKGVMNKFMNDYYDGTSGRMVKGRDSAFAALTANDVTKEVWKQGEAHPGDWMKYSNWAKTEFATQLGTYARELNDTSPFANVPGVGYKSDYKLAYSSDAKQLILTKADGSPLEGLQNTDYNVLHRSVSNINMGLRNMANIAKTEGSNVDAYLFKVLKDNGFAPDKDIDGVPAQIMRSMIASRKKPKPNE